MRCLTSSCRLLACSLAAGLLAGSCRDKPAAPGAAITQVMVSPDPSLPPAPTPSSLPAVSVEDDLTPAQRAERAAAAPSQVTFHDVTAVKGTTVVAAVNRVLLYRKQLLAECYQKQGAPPPAAKGHLVVEWDVDVTGMSARAQVVEDGLGVPGVPACVEEVLRRIRFLRPEAGDLVTLRARFGFAPLEPPAKP